MKQKIYLSLCVMAIGLMTGCGQKSPPPTVIVTPTPTPTPIVPAPTPSPATILPSPKLPPVVTSPVVVKVPKLKPTPQVSSSTTTVLALPESFYPQPTPVPIPATPAPVKPKTKANSKTEAISKLKLPTDPAQQITPVGIGSAKIGMSLKELKEQTGAGFEFKVKPSLIEGFDAIAVTKAGAVQYYIPYPAGTQFTDTDRIQHLMTDNPNYRTPQGVGPGTSIGQAVSVYGDATLSLSKENESREFISFTQHPSGLAFRPKPVGSRPFAGDYPDSNDEYLKTQKYDTKAAIGQITVSCPEDKCDPEH
jgi:hypothetical protein